jgi:N-methylhydantoinase B
VKLVSGGELNRDVLALITANSRAPEERIGDFRAQIAAHRVGETRLKALADVHSVDVLVAHAAALQDYSETLTRDLIQQIPGGRYHYTDVMESDGQTEDPITISCWIDVIGDEIVVDFAGTSPQVAGNINAVPAIVRSATYYCVQLLAAEAIPVNDGCFRPIDVRVPDSSLLNPVFPAAVAVGNTETSQRIVDTVLGALAAALPGRIPAAGQGTMNNLTIGGQRADGTAFVYYETIGGGHGAGPLGDGLSGRHSHMTNTLNTPVEALEYALPFRVSAYHLRDDTGGAGRWRGGDGIVRTYEFLTPVTVTINSERRRAGPPGRAGGSAGAVGENVAVRGGVDESLPGKATARFAPGDCLSICTPSGGGWGTV